MTRTVRIAVAFSLGATLGACSVRLSSDAKFTCAADLDCGGDGFVCTPPVKHLSWCCHPTNGGVEICDGIDNDCNGIIDDTGKAEICNGIDDNCDGRIDEGFDLQNDRSNCGACNHACGATQDCIQGTCTTRVETNCSDGIDNDGNGLTDCADPSCNQLSCGPGCVCKTPNKTEVDCNNGLDDDKDGLTDCADPDCIGLSCGTGCACAPDAGKTETICFDALDNNANGKIDCADPDCAGKYCTDPASKIFFTCDSKQHCNCNGGAQVQESTNALCSDGIDNDCDGLTDCADPHCDTKACTLADAGTGVCQGGACR